jgi:2,4-dienoyl-CoA reductase-like NADH-dependent reductase (Old Yellow Enzyme family)
MTLRNRLVMSPMETMYGTPDGLPSERTRDYFAARAKGGVGLITVGATGIDPTTPRRRADCTWAPTRPSTPTVHWSTWSTSTAPRSSRRSCTQGPTASDRRCTA